MKEINYMSKDYKIYNQKEIQELDIAYLKQMYTELEKDSNLQINPEDIKLEGAVIKQGTMQGDLAKRKELKDYRTMVLKEIQERKQKN